MKSIAFILGIFGIVGLGMAQGQTQIRPKSAAPAMTATPANSAQTVASNAVFIEEFDVLDADTWERQSPRISPNWIEFTSYNNAFLIGADINSGGITGNVFSTQPNGASRCTYQLRANTYSWTQEWIDTYTISDAGAEAVDDSVEVEFTITVLEY